MKLPLERQDIMGHLIPPFLPSIRFSHNPRNKSKRWAKEKAEIGTMDFLTVLKTWTIVSSLERHGPNVSTTPLRHWGFLQCLPFSWSSNFYIFYDTQKRNRKTTTLLVILKIL